MIDCRAAPERPAYVGICLRSRLVFQELQASFRTLFKLVRALLPRRSLGV